MSHNVRVPADGSEPEATEEEATFHVDAWWTHRKFGLKLDVDMPAPWEDDGEAKETFKNVLDWEHTHRSWNDGRGAWEVDFDHLNLVVDKLTDAGHDVTVDLDVARKFEDEGFEFLPEHREHEESDELDGFEAGDRVAVTYESANADGDTVTVEGFVSARTDHSLRARRDGDRDVVVDVTPGNGHTVYTRGEGGLRRVSVEGDAEIEVEHADALAA